MKTENTLVFSYTAASEGERQFVQFKGTHEFGDVAIQIAAQSPVNTSEVDTSRGDVETNHAVGVVEFEIKSGAELLLSLSIVRGGFEHVEAVNPRVAVSDYAREIERCHELAGVLFEKGLTVTWFAPAGGEVAQ